WTADEWIGETATIYSGTCATVSQTIIDNDTNSITVSGWGCTPDNTSVYKITSKDEWTTGKFGSALSFDGVDDNITIMDSDSIDVSNAITISAWVNPISFPNAVNEIVSKWGDNVNQRSYLFNVTSAGIVRFFISPDGTATSQIGFGTSQAIDTNTWSHLVATSDGTTMKIFVNGIQDSNNLTADTIFNGTSPVAIGALSPPDGSSLYVFSGKIDDVRIYNYART
ncbi:MAG: LamG domain-containing protein, partial [Patescibacteria group bacterium]|nr:LamG domain-containing protein [Patescibacteria group bacterium]